MHAPKPVNWAAAQTALAAERGAMEILAALFGVETWDDVKHALEQQRDPDITIHARHCAAYVFRAPGATDEQVYTSLRDVVERALPGDPPMHEINGRLRRELDLAEAKQRELSKQAEDWQAEASAAHKRVRQLEATIAGMSMELERLHGARLL